MQTGRNALPNRDAGLAWRMYRNCIFCSSDLGTNESLEAFPVGHRVAFDGARGRLWVVCGRCARWNLAPIEERWEPVEQAEKLFRDARQRVQSQNVGLARLPDGTELVRVGDALDGELAAWRYGRQLLERRHRHALGVAGAVVVGMGVVGGLSAAGVSVTAWLTLSTAWDGWQKQRVVHRVAPADDPTRAGATLRRWHVPGMRLAPAAEGGVALVVHEAHRKRPSAWTSEVNWKTDDVTVLPDVAARSALARAITRVNESGAGIDGVDEAGKLLADAGSAERYLRDAAGRSAALGKRAGKGFHPLKGPPALALEMALHEESERRALEGELAALAAAWREAEEIAAIADRLPFDIPLPRWRRP